MERSETERHPSDGARQFLDVQREVLLEAIRELEDLGFHHSPEGTVEGDHYTRLIKGLEVLNAQAAKLPQRIKSSEERRKEGGDGVVD